MGEFAAEDSKNHLNHGSTGRQLFYTKHVLSVFLAISLDSVVFFFSLSPNVLTFFKVLYFFSLNSACLQQNLNWIRYLVNEEVTWILFLEFSDKLVLTGRNELKNKYIGQGNAFTDLVAITVPGVIGLLLQNIKFQSSESRSKSALWRVKMRGIIMQFSLRSEH